MTNKEYKRDKRSPVPKNGTVSKVMSAIKSKETKPEVQLRKALFSVGLRGYRKNLKELPGKPDIAYTKWKIAIFINGCYWHGCQQCGWKPPKHNTEYWVNKINKNRQRDLQKIDALKSIGYKVITIWEHELKGSMDLVVKKIHLNLM
ncbi:very short patch repair endonuclease [Chitinophaga sp.]|uniref:very short patch repair endonuclease n=1 Tax=Chitinophaga sp. TaxID=1869181 RepID=UPI0031DABC7E